jgi:integrase
LIFETGLRSGEALALYLEDLSLTLDDEHFQVVGKGDKRRTVLLDDTRLVKELRTYLKHTGYKHGPLFRAIKNGEGALCGTNQTRNGGESTGRRQVSPARCINSATRIPPNWSTMA